MSSLIELTKGYFALVDESDHDWLSEWKWSASVGKRHVYAQRAEGGKIVLMHRLIMCTPEGMETDHKNRNGLDNRRSNLRVCTKAQNQHNTWSSRPGLSSAYKGVCWRPGSKNKPWVAQINRGGKTTYLGLFSSEIEAALAYNTAALEQYGEYARINDIESKAAGCKSDQGRY